VEIAQWLYGLGGINIRAKDDRAFFLACESNLEIAKWLYSLNPIDISVANLNDRFSNICIMYHFDLAQWLYYEVGHENINIHYNNDLAFVYGMKSGQIELVQWLYSLGGFERSITEELIKEIIQKGHLSLAIWLHAMKVNLE
jgi:hypothetical protein